MGLQNGLKQNLELYNIKDYDVKFMFVGVQFNTIIKN